ncbi:MAG: zinc ribbon domain-containing protein [Methanobrevibacter sp.]|nr:zinc ribbon domain-containing protein [Methanobrevibacter sp.]
MVYCSLCGTKSKSQGILCEKCGSLLKDKKYLELNRLENFNEIVTDSNLKILNENPLSTLEYEIILKNIVEMGKEYIKNYDYEFSTTNVLGKIKIITKSYADVQYKSKGAEQGSYSYNRIMIDDRLNDCDIISTLIHELAHHLFNEIFEQMLMYIWEVEKTDAIEAFVSFTLGTNPVYLLMNEYCAHSVEGRFIPHGYQRYGSFNNILNEEFDLENDTEVISFALMMGNSLADDIIHILENFINDDVRSQIKQEYIRSCNSAPDYEEMILESDEVLPVEEKLKHMHVILMSGIALSGDENCEEIFSVFKEGYRIHNTK